MSTLTAKPKRASRAKKVAEQPVATEPIPTEAAVEEQKVDTLTELAVPIVHPATEDEEKEQPTKQSKSKRKSGVRNLVRQSREEHEKVIEQCTDAAIERLLMLVDKWASCPVNVINQWWSNELMLVDNADNFDCRGSECSDKLLQKMLPIFNRWWTFVNGKSLIRVKLSESKHIDMDIASFNWAYRVIANEFCRYENADSRELAFCELWLRSSTRESTWE